MTKKLLFASSLALAGSFWPAVASAQTSTPTPASTRPTLSAPVLIAHGPGASRNNSHVVPNDLNSTTGSCPYFEPGVSCTVTYLVGPGYFDTQFCYLQGGNLFECLPPYVDTCPYSFCEYSQTGGGPPPIIPISWSVAGNSAYIISVTTP